jgi:hypothetical protein
MASYNQYKLRNKPQSAWNSFTSGGTVYAPTFGGTGKPAYAPIPENFDPSKFGAGYFQMVPYGTELTPFPWQVRTGVGSDASRQTAYHLGIGGGPGQQASRTSMQYRTGGTMDPRTWVAYNQSATFNPMDRTNNIYSYAQKYRNLFRGLR